MKCAGRKVAMFSIQTLSFAIDRGVSENDTILSIHKLYPPWIHFVPSSAVFGFPKTSPPLVWLPA